MAKSLRTRAFTTFDSKEEENNDVTSSFLILCLHLQSGYTVCKYLLQKFEFESWGVEKI